MKKKLWKNFETERVTINELKLPHRVYKYRDANDPFHRKMLTEQNIYFAAPKDFEDKFDCKAPVRFDLLTDDEIYNKYYKELK